MKKTFLLPNNYKKIGWLFFIPSLILGNYILISGFEFSFLNFRVLSLLQNGNDNSKYFEQVNLTYTLVGVLFLIGALLVGFSKEKIEDEYIDKLRLSSLIWAVFINTILLILAFLLVYNFSFLMVMTYNMFTVLMLFIFRFQYLLYRSKIVMNDEK